MAEYERRAWQSLEVRQGGGQPPRLRGYAAVFNAHSLDLGGFVEIIRPGAFRRALQDGTDVRAFVDHNPTLIIGRRSAGTLVLSEDAQGLHVEITPPDTQAGRDVLENVRIGHLDGMSFAFRVAPDGERWHLREKPPLRELVDLDVPEVSVVALPAYPQTEVALRSLAALGHYPRGRTVAERLAWTQARAR